MNENCPKEAERTAFDPECCTIHGSTGKKCKYKDCIVLLQNLEDEYCVKHDPDHIKKIQEKGSHHLEKITFDYILSKDIDNEIDFDLLGEGVNGDMIFKPKYVKKDKYVNIQLKSSTLSNKYKTYAFNNVNEYDILVLCIAFLKQMMKHLSFSE